jgi:peptide chain release factor 1
LKSTTERLSVLANDLQTSLIPEHPFAGLPCLIELRPGAGGDEAALFAGDLLRMYQAYCRRHGLRVNLLKLDTAASVGVDDQIQEAVLEIERTGAYDMFRCEAGVHRVQRVPATESKGRTHTSAVSVLVLPSFPKGEDELGESNFDDPASDYHVDVKDVRVETMRAGGAGGQHVDKTDSAIRLTHLPTNTVVAMQDSRSQHQNRTKAWQILRAKLAQARREAREEEMAQLRIGVVGVSRMGRGDKIRTYNWGQQRVTDHRSGITVRNLDDTLEGGESLDKVMASVKDWLKLKDVESIIADEEAARVKAEDQTRMARPHI